MWNALRHCSDPSNGGCRHLASRRAEHPHRQRNANAAPAMRRLGKTAYRAMKSAPVLAHFSFRGIVCRRPYIVNQQIDATNATLRELHMPKDK